MVAKALNKSSNAKSLYIGWLTNDYPRVYVNASYDKVPRQFWETPNY